MYRLLLELINNTPEEKYGEILNILYKDVKFHESISTEYNEETLCNTLRNTIGCINRNQGGKNEIIKI